MAPPDNGDDNAWLRPLLASTLADEPDPDARQRIEARARADLAALRAAGFSSHEIEALVRGGLLSLGDSPLMAAPNLPEPRRAWGSSYRRLNELLEYVEAIEEFRGAGDVRQLTHQRKELVRFIDRRTGGNARAVADAITLAADVGLVANFLEHIANGDGTPRDRYLLRQLVELLTTVTREWERAQLVAMLSESIQELYAEKEWTVRLHETYSEDGDALRTREKAHRPARRLEEIPEEDFAGVVEELRDELRCFDEVFAEIPEEVITDLLQRADPAKPKPLAAPYIAAALAISSGAYGEKQLEGESFAEACRRVSNVFRNASTNETKRTA